MLFCGVRPVNYSVYARGACYPTAYGATGVRKPLNVLRFIRVSDGCRGLIRALVGRGRRTHKPGPRSLVECLTFAYFACWRRQRRFAHGLRSSMFEQLKPKKRSRSVRSNVSKSTNANAGEKCRRRVRRRRRRKKRTLKLIEFVTANRPNVFESAAAVVNWRKQRTKINKNVRPGRVLSQSSSFRYF